MQRVLTLWFRDAKKNIHFFTTHNDGESVYGLHITQGSKEVDARAVKGKVIVNA